MKAVYIAGVLWLAYAIIKQFIHPYGPQSEAEFAIGVMVMAGVGAYLFKDTK